jgi:hypothetical protein
MNPDAFLTERDPQTGWRLLWVLLLYEKGGSRFIKGLLYFRHVKIGLDFYYKSE